MSSQANSVRRTSVIFMVRRMLPCARHRRSCEPQDVAGLGPRRPRRAYEREEAMAPRPLPSEKEVTSWIRERRNWGRWGKDDQKGAINLITPAKRVAAARLVKSGRSVSLSRPFPKEPGPNNTLPAQHYMKTAARGKGR